MNLYLIVLRDNQYYVEAKSYTHAIEVWNCCMKLKHDDWIAGDPCGITKVNDEPAIRNQ